MSHEVPAAGMAEGRLLIRYISKPNGGVHTAHNAAIREAKGKLFLRLDTGGDYP